VTSVKLVGLELIEEVLESLALEIDVGTAILSMIWSIYVPIDSASVCILMVYNYVCLLMMHMCAYTAYAIRGGPLINTTW